MKYMTIINVMMSELENELNFWADRGWLLEQIVTEPAITIIMSKEAE